MSEFERLTFYNEDGAAVRNRYLETNSVISWGKAIDRLAQYEDSRLSPAEVAELAKAKEEGRLVILPSKSDEIIRIIELALRIKLYDWQKAYITGVSDYVMPGRVSGKTTAYMLKLCLSEGEPIDLTKRKEIERYADGIHGSQYLDYFKHELWNIYLELKRVGGLERRKIYFSERDKHDRR